MAKSFPHIEDSLFDGRPGFERACNALREVHNGLLGKKIALSVKMDGAPAIVFGYHPSNGQFFVATKAFWNVTPKINYTEQDIDNNHTTSEELRQKLKVALKFLPLVVKEGVFQGDFLYSHPKPGINSLCEFEPNTIRYVPKDNEFGCKMLCAELGIAVHTQFRGPSMVPQYEVDSTYFRNHSDVHIFDTKIDLSKITYHRCDQDEVCAYLDDAWDALYSAYNWCPAPPDVARAYVQECIKGNKTPETSDFLHMHPYLFIKTVDETRLDKVFKTYNNLTHVKNVLMRILDRHSIFKHYIGSNESKPEGYVLGVERHAVKLVDRYEFSRINQLQGRFRYNEKAAIRI